MSEDDVRDDMSLERQWSIIEYHYMSGKPLTAHVIEATRSSLIVDVRGIRGTIEKPAYYVFDMLDSADQSDEERQRSREEHIERQLAQMRGQEMTVRVIEVDRQRNHLVLSQQLYTDEEREAMLRRREQLLRELRPGDVRRGVVKSFTRLGVRVDLEEVEGWIYRGYLSEHRVDNPGEIVQIGQEVEVMVLECDKGHLRLSLVHAQLRDKVLHNLHPADVQPGRILSLSADGVYVDLGGPLGLIPTDQIAHDYITHPADLFHTSQEVVVRIEHIDDDKGVLLSLVEAR